MPRTSGTAPTSRHRIGAVEVSLTSDLPRVADDFAALYPPVDASASNAGSVIRLDVRRAGRSRFARRLYQVRADGQEIGGVRPSNSVFPLLEWGINLRVMATRSEFLQLHAASMAHRGNGYIFAGDSGRGKSTLSAILLAGGWGYLCDEFALVAPDTLELQPFPKGVCIKAGSAAVVRRLGLRFAHRRHYLKELKGRVGYIDPRQCGESAIDSPCPVRVVVLPEYVEGAAARLEPISRAQAAMALYRCCFNRHCFRDDALPVLSQLVEACACYRLTIGAPADTVSLLEGCLSTAERPAALTTRPAARLSPGTTASVRKRPTSRRDMLRLGARMAYVAPAVLTLSAHQALAAGSHPSGICSTALNTGELCATNSDCCSKECNFGVCQ